MKKGMNQHASVALLCLTGVASVEAADTNSVERLEQLELRMQQLEQESQQRGSAGELRRESNRYNPAVAVFLNGKYNRYRQPEGEYALPGFQLGGEAGLSSEGLTAEETEIGLSGNVDDRVFASVTLGIHQAGAETELDLEEAFIETLGLPAGLGLKAGRFYSELGYLNRQHSHSWDFADQPLVYRAFLGDQYTDNGIQLRWVAPTDIYLQIGTEYMRGDGFPAAGSGKSGAGANIVFAHLGGDIGSSHSWRAGVSTLQAEAHERLAGGEEGHAHGAGGVEPSVFDGDSDLWVLDLVWKWAPDGNVTDTNLKIQAEYFSREEAGEVSVDDGAEITEYEGEQDGWYLQAVYQFMPRWRVGLRYDVLNSDNQAADPDVLEEAGLSSEHSPKRTGIMLDYSRNEFSRLRLQYNHDESLPGEADQQWTLQYIVSFGAHGGHQF